MSVQTRQQLNDLELDQVIPEIQTSPSPSGSADAILAAVTANLTVELVKTAIARKIAVSSVAFEVGGSLGGDEISVAAYAIWRGHQGVELRMRIESDATDEEINELWAHLQRTSPLLDPRRNPVPMIVGLAA